jgi:SAM-dependent MidA family methyltransferase
MLRAGTLIVLDYVDDAAGVLRRGDWLRTYRAHAPGESPLEQPGAQDITADVVREQLVHAARAAGFTPASDMAQADWLRALGIDELAAAGRRTWEERAHIGDLDALAGRSRAVEAVALTDGTGLGAHRVVTFSR